MCRQGRRQSTVKHHGDESILLLLFVGTLFLRGSSADGTCLKTWVVLLLCVRVCVYEWTVDVQRG